MTLGMKNSLDQLSLSYFQRHVIRDYTVCSGKNICSTLMFIKQSYTDISEAVDLCLHIVITLPSYICATLSTLSGGMLIKK